MVEAHGLQTVAIYGWVLFIQQLLGVMMMMFLGDDFHVKEKNDYEDFFRQQLPKQHFGLYPKEEKNLQSSLCWKM